MKEIAKKTLILLLFNNHYMFKGIVSVISSDPPCKDDNARFTTVHFKALPDQVLIRNQC